MMLSMWVNEQVQLSVECLQPFMEPPKLQLGYKTGGQSINQTLKLPLLTTKFLIPEPDITRDAFFEHWKAYAGILLCLSGRLLSKMFACEFLSVHFVEINPPEKIITAF